MDREPDIKIKLCEIDGGRFKDIIQALDITDVCGRCNYFNLSINDRTKGYRCHCTGSCIAATLHTKLISYLNWKMGWITEKQHNVNCGI